MQKDSLQEFCACMFSDQTRYEITMLCSSSFLFPFKTKYGIIVRNKNNREVETSLHCNEVTVYSSCLIIGFSPLPPSRKAAHMEIFCKEWIKPPVSFHNPKTWQFLIKQVKYFDAFNNMMYNSFSNTKCYIIFACSSSSVRGHTCSFKRFYRSTEIRVMIRDTSMGFSPRSQQWAFLLYTTFKKPLLYLWDRLLLKSFFSVIIAVFTFSFSFMQNH